MDKVCGIKITNGNRKIFPKSNVSKLDVAIFYEKIANKILPYIKNRPLSVIRCHDKIYKEKFFKKHAQKNENVERFVIKNKNHKNEEYFYINSKKQLINQIQLGTVEFHTWNFKVQNLNCPDYMIFDLDPDETIDIETLRKATMLVKKFLNQLSLKCYLKTSGGKGYHIYAKIDNLNSKQVQNFSKQIALALEQKYPQIFVTNLSKQKRIGKIFVDYLRNKKGATCVCAYSLRLKENAPISVPISWNKLNKILPNEITIKNFEKYL